jgi:hypothetical protein
VSNFQFIIRNYSTARIGTGDLQYELESEKLWLSVWNGKVEQKGSRREAQTGFTNKDVCRYTITFSKKK